MTSISDDASFTARELQKADMANNFSSVFAEIERDFRTYSPADFQVYLKHLNTELARTQILPTVSIESFDPVSHKLAVKLNGQSLRLDANEAVRHLDKTSLESSMRQNTNARGPGDRQVLSKQTPDNRTINFDNQGRVTDIVNNDNSRTSYSRDAEGKIVQAVTKDNSGQVVRTDRMEAGAWVSYDGSNPPRKTGEIRDASQVNVTTAGNLEINASGGKVVQKGSDGSQVKYDEQGHVTRVDYKGGGFREFKYQGGQLSEVQYDNGRGYKDSWKREGDGFQNYDSSGNRTAHKLKDLTVSQDGTVREKQTNSEKITGTDHLTYDPATTKVKADRSKVTVDGQGKVSDVVAANGTQKHFEYGADGKVSKIQIQAPGARPEVWEKNGDSWVRQGDRATYQGQTEVDRQGNVTTKFAAGGSRIDNTDGSSISRNGDNQITAITDAHGAKREFRYENGKLAEVKYQAPGLTESWKMENGVWINYNSANVPTGRTRADIVLKQDGTILEHDKNSNHLRTIAPNGASELSKVPPGFDAQRPQDSTPPSQSQPQSRSWQDVRRQAMQSQKAEISSTNSRTIQSGDTLWDIARAHLELQNRSSTQPSNQQVLREVQRLAQLNGIADANRIPIGTKIKMSR